MKNKSPNTETQADINEMVITLRLVNSVRCWDVDLVGAEDEFCQVEYLFAKYFKLDKIAVLLIRNEAYQLLWEPEESDGPFIFCDLQERIFAHRYLIGRAGQS